MTDEEYRGLVLQHDKHIDKLALSIEHIAEAKWYLNHTTMRGLILTTNQ